MEDCPWICSSLFRSSRRHTAERGCSQTLQILAPRLGSSHALAGMGEAFPALAVPLSPGKSLMDSPLGICGAIALPFCLQSLLPSWSHGHGPVWSQGRQQGLLVPGSSGPGGTPCSGGEKQAPLWKTPPIRGKTGAQTHGCPQPPRVLFKDTVKDKGPFGLEGEI